MGEENSNFLLSADDANLCPWRIFFLAYCNERVINLFFGGRTFDRYLSPSFSPFLRTMHLVQ